ncbi:MAG: DUF1801 domain-containing protein [Phycisphaera sp.]|nr:MAG: DUF1801 domain-containing protein [Phycisphaera sp.]
MPSPDDFIMELPAAVRKRAAKVRRLVLDLAPHSAERVTWDAISFFDAERGGPIKGSICQLVHRKGVLRLDFPLGEFMEDPEGVLSGEVGRKGKRFVEIGPTLPRDASIQTLIESSLSAPSKPKRLPKR